MDWRKTAIDFQQEICENLGDISWDVYQEEEVNILKDKVRVILYGPSTDTRTRKGEALVNKICEVIEKEGTYKLKGVSERKAIYMVFIFIIGTKNGHHIESWPVFKVPKDGFGFDSCFIDMNCRVYKDWKDFLSNNKLPAREYCYPRNGNYYLIDGKVSVEFGKAPRAEIKSKVLNAMDLAGAGIGIGSTIVTAASLCVPVAGPLLAASIYAAGGISAYSAFRSTNTLYDRKVHKQSIGLIDKEARSCYLNIAGSVVGLGATAATAATIKAAQSGRVVGELATTAVTTLNGGALVINGVGLVNGLHQLYMKHREGQLSPLDVAQFSAYLLLFCHATVNFQTARSIIEKSQNYVIQDYENSLGSEWKRMAFRTVVKCSTKLHGSQGGKSLVIRSIRQINSVDDYFASQCPENETLSSKVSCIVMLHNIGQRFGLNYLDMLLSAYEQFELSEVLRRFTEPFQNIIMKLCDRLFHSITQEQAQGFNFMNIAGFIIKFVHQMIIRVFKGEQEYIFSLFSHRIRPIPCSEMTPVEFCFAVLEEIIRNPSSILELYKLMQSFFQILLDKALFHQGDYSKNLNIDFLQFFSFCSILQKTDKPYWKTIIDFAKGIFDLLNLRKFSSLVQILKQVFLYIEGKVLDMQSRNKTLGNTTNASNRANSEMQVNYHRAIDSLFTNGERESFVSSIREKNLDTISDPICNGGQSVYTEKNPLVLRKSFAMRKQQLLTRDEILDIFKKTLRLDNLPSDFRITQHNLQTFVRSGDSVVVITCDIENEKTLSYSRLLVLDLLQNSSQILE